MSRRQGYLGRIEALLAAIVVLVIIAVLALLMSGCAGGCTEDDGIREVLHGKNGSVTIICKTGRIIHD